MTPSTKWFTAAYKSNSRGSTVFWPLKITEFMCKYPLIHTYTSYVYQSLGEGSEGGREPEMGGRLRQMAGAQSRCHMEGTVGEETAEQAEQREAEYQEPNLPTPVPSRAGETMRGT